MYFEKIGIDVDKNYAEYLNFPNRYDYDFNFKSYEEGEQFLFSINKPNKTAEEQTAYERIAEAILTLK